MDRHSTNPAGKGADHISGFTQNWEIANTFGVVSRQRLVLIAGLVDSRVSVEEVRIRQHNSLDYRDEHFLLVLYIVDLGFKTMFYLI